MWPVTILLNIFNTHLPALMFQIILQQTQQYYDNGGATTYAICGQHEQHALPFVGCHDTDNRVLSGHDGVDSLLLQSTELCLFSYQYFQLPIDINMIYLLELTELYFIANMLLFTI